MLTPKQIKIFEVFMREPFKSFTYSQIKQFSNEKSNSIIQKAIYSFIEENLILKEKIGNLFVYNLNLDNSSVFAYFNILQKEKFSPVLKKSIEIITKKLEITFMSMVIFGSYADGSQTKKSDLDIAVFVSDEKDKKNCQIAFKSVELQVIMDIDFYVFTKQEMLEMLQDKFENLGKQIASKHLTVHNPMIFYSIIEEGINNGFKIVYSKSRK